MMSPMDLLLLFCSLTSAATALLIHGWTWNGIALAMLATAGGFWQLWMQWLRHQSWLRHRDSGFAPGTQRLALSAAIGWFLATVGADVWMFATWSGFPSPGS